MAPKPEFAKAVGRGALIDRAPKHSTNAEWYRRAWKVQSPRLEKLSTHIVELGRTALPPGSSKPERKRAG